MRGNFGNFGKMIRNNFIFNNTNDTMNAIKQVLLLLILSGLLIAGCRPMGKKDSIKNEKSLASVPTWAKEAIWYQIFVERFRNGDPSNDPTPADMAGAVSYTHLRAHETDS